MKSFTITGEVSGTRRGFILEISGEKEGELHVTLRDTRDPLTAIAEWEDDDIASFIALQRLAATAREAEYWCDSPLEIPGPEWGPDGADPCIHFWLDKAWVTVKAPRGPKRMQLRFDVVCGDGLLKPYFIRCTAGELARFGRELTAHLATIQPEDDRPGDPGIVSGREPRAARGVLIRS